MELTREDSARRKRAAVELIAREGDALRRTATRYSICADDAEDAYQRALEILLTKAPTDRPRDLARWTQTVTKHEALAIRATRERLLGASRREEAEPDPVALIPAAGDGPAGRTERRERVARSREALQALKPAELRALTLLAAGYSYAEIGELTGFSQTKINRCLAEGRERFRRVVAGSEDGSRCAEMGPLLSAYCDGETSAEQRETVREHLRACAGCRATMRAYRSTPSAVAALVPALPLSRSLAERAQELVDGLHVRLTGVGAGADSSAAQVAAAGGTRGAGMAALAKALAICAGTVGGACVASGVVPVPLGLVADREQAPRVERVSPQALESDSSPAVEYQPAPEAGEPSRPKPKREPPRAPAAHPEAGADATEPPAGAVEYAPPPPSPPAAEAAPTEGPVAASSGSAAGEFGP